MAGMSSPLGRAALLSSILLGGLPACIPVLSPPGRLDVGGGFRTGVKAEPSATTTAPRQDARFGPVRSTPPATAGDSVLVVSGGVHLASVLPRRNPPVDVGVGYVFTDIGLGDRKLHGIYGEFTPIATAGSWWRLVAGARGEAQFADRSGAGAGYTFLGRVGIETFSPTSEVGDDDRMLVVGGAYGVYGIGGFVEAGGHKLPGGEQAVLVLGGLSLRFPASAGVLLIAR